MIWFILGAILGGMIGAGAVYLYEIHILNGFEARIADINRRVQTTITGPRVAYICDRRACGNCNPDCHHTFDITHARNFECVCENEYWEKGDDTTNSNPKIQDGSSYFLTPEEARVTLAECPVGLFEYDGVLGMKTEYMTANGDGTYKIDAYIVYSGERFCISNDTPVRPCSIWIADGDSDE